MSLLVIVRSGGCGGVLGGGRSCMPWIGGFDSSKLHINNDVSADTSQKVYSSESYIIGNSHCIKADAVKIAIAIQCKQSS